MIELTRLDGSEVIVNVDLIERVEQTPDTLVSLSNGGKLWVRETPGELVARAVEYKRSIAMGGNIFGAARARSHSKTLTGR